MKRVAAKRKCPNPLFIKWLTEWREEAKAKGSKLENNFAKAITSLQKYPLPFETGRDCIIIQNFGDKLCAMLDRKLEHYYEAQKQAHRSDTEQVNTCDNVESDIMAKKSRHHEENLLRDNVKSKIKIISVEKKITPAPILIRRFHFMSSSDSDNDDSPMNGISNVKDKHSDKPVSSEETRDKRRREQEKCKVVAQKSKSPDIESSENAAILVRDEFQIASNNFDVLLLVDIHETAGAKSKSKEDATKSELDRLHAPYEIRHLKIGDFAWVARCRDTNRELILPYIVERKRMDDLASSIKDGRYHEQKFRLKQSGIPNLIYMIERYGNNQHLGIPLPTLFQAATNSLVQEGFTVKFTNSHRDSMKYLSTLTTLIQKIYKAKNLVSSTKDDLNTPSTSGDSVALMEFQRFNKAASKVKIFKVREMFVRQLIQLKGLSVEKALAIVELYQTPKILTEAFVSAGREGEKLLSTIQCGASKRQLGPSLSKIIYELYTRRTLE